MTLNKLTMIAATFTVAIAVDAATITGVSARQRWPWNNLVDVDFTISGNVGDVYAIDIKASVSGGEKILNAQTFATEPIATAGVKTRVVWDLGADYPGFHSDDFKVTVTATPFSDSTPLYCVIDISGGPTAAKYPVRYTTAAPVFTVGNPDPCKTTELWLKRVKAGRVKMGNNSASYGQYSASYPSHYCTLTNDYYLGVFPVTQSQFANIQTTGDESQFTNALYSATRPVDAVEFGTVRSTTSWSTYLTSDAVEDDCVIGRLRNRTGLALIDLPTEWQWEYACRAGSNDGRYEGCTTSDFRHSKNSNPPSDYEFKADKGLWSEDYGTSYVDRYAPNHWGFYGMLGNVKEYCANYIDSSFTENQEVTEPRGGTPANSDSSKWKRAHGGHWNQASTGIFCFTGSRINTWGNFSDKAENNGFRLCITLREPMQ